MSFDDFSNDLIIYLGHFLPNPSLNSLIQTHKRCATLLTPHLYNPEIRFKVSNEHQYAENTDPKNIPLRCLDCAHRWKSNLIQGYFREQPNRTFTLVDQYGRTLLHHIAAQGNTQILEILLSKGADIEARSLVTDTPLLIAAARQNEPVLRGLLKAGANPRAMVRTNITILVQAIFTKSLSIVQCLIDALESGPDGIWAPITSGAVLHRAVFTGSEPIVRLLLDHGADLVGADGYGTTCLNGAVIWGYKDIINLLLDRGAEILQGDSLGRTVITEIGDGLGAPTIQRIVRAYIEAGGGFTTTLGDIPVLHVHAGRGLFLCIEALIDNGADVFSTMSNGATALMCALLHYNENSEGDYERVCQALIKAMASTVEDMFVATLKPGLSAWGETREVTGMTALHVAAEVGVECIVLLLIEAGANVLTMDDRRRTPLLCALLARNEGVCLLLAEQMKLRGYDFSTPLTATIPNNYGQLFETMLELATDWRMDALCSFLNTAGG